MHVRTLLMPPLLLLLPAAPWPTPLAPPAPKPVAVVVVVVVADGSHPPPKAPSCSVVAFSFGGESVEPDLMEGGRVGSGVVVGWVA